MAKSERTRYSSYVKDQVRKRYPLCRTTADRQALADELGIGSVAKLYNLASRLGATGPQAPDEEGHARHVEAHAAERLLIREDPQTTELSPQARRYLRDEFGKRTVEEIAYYLHHSETAVMYWARKLGLRRPVKHWSLSKVALWLGMDADEVKAQLAPAGVDIYPLGDLRGRVVMEVVSTTSLARWLKESKNLKRVRVQGADEFFLSEILESVQDLLEEKTEWERCKFLSHGHVCQNPFTENSFGLFCTRTEKQEAGEDPKCSVRLMRIEDLRPDHLR